MNRLRCALDALARRPVLALIVALPLTVTGCTEGYCQSGPKYGTQCYSMNDIELQETMSRGEPPPPERQTTPSPGCVLATPSGLVQQPLSGGGSVPASSYLMSGACVTQRQTTQGALR